MAGILQEARTLQMERGEPLRCLRCDEPANKGFYWSGHTEVAVCQDCVAPIIAAMIFDLVRKENHHVTWDIVKTISDQVEERLRRLSRNLDGAMLESGER